MGGRVRGSRDRRDRGQRPARPAGSAAVGPLVGNRSTAQQLPVLRTVGPSRLGRSPRRYSQPCCSEPLRLRPGDARRLLTGALIVGLAGLLLAVISSSVAEIRILVQGQPWRWLWLGRFLATALLPLILIAVWRDGAAGRCAAMLLAAAWLLNGRSSYREIPPIGASGLLCVLAILVWVVRNRLPSSGLRALTLVATASLGWSPWCSCRSCWSP